MNHVWYISLFMVKYTLGFPKRTIKSKVNDGELRTDISYIRLVYKYVMFANMFAASASPMRNFHEGITAAFSKPATFSHISHVNVHRIIDQEIFSVAPIAKEGGASLG